MKQTISIIGILILAVVLSGCALFEGTKPLIEPARIESITYETYGAFTTPETNRQTLIITENKTEFFLAHYNGSETFRSVETNTESYKHIRSVLNKGNFQSLHKEQTSDIPIADVGAAKLTVVYDNGTKKAVTFDPNVPSEYGLYVEKIFDTLNQIRTPFWEKYYATLSQPDEPRIVEAAYQPMQCESTPWEEWYANGSVQFLREPTDTELIAAYYSSELNVNIEAVRKVDFDGAVCEACSVCAEP